MGQLPPLLEAEPVSAEPVVVVAAVGAALAVAAGVALALGVAVAAAVLVVVSDTGTALVCDVVAVAAVPDVVEVTAVDVDASDVEEFARLTVSAPPPITATAPVVAVMTLTRWRARSRLLAASDWRGVMSMTQP